MTDAARTPVSIIIPVYNVERYLDDCLDSIRGQTYKRLEIIVAEDRSIDDLLEKLTPHLTDPHMRLIRREGNSGPSAERNTSIEAGLREEALHVDRKYFSGRLSSGYRRR